MNLGITMRGDVLQDKLGEGRIRQRECTSRPT
jgi:hypothetical protein